MHTVKTTWSYKCERSYKKDTVSNNRKVYIHYYYNIDKAAEDEKRLDKLIVLLRNELLEGKTIKEHEALYAKYFNLIQTTKHGLKVEVKKDVVSKTKRYYGFFALMTNEKMSAKEALQVYRNRDVVEKAFGNLKERLNLRRLLVSSEQSLEGKLFVAFIALIYLSYIKKKMQEAGLFKDYTIATLLDKLDLIECFEVSGHNIRFGEILKKQYEIYEALGVKPPASL
ncbi:transposase [Desulfurella sp.]|uniref:IS1634 family transposase n=1 Tax=Desulfurella sp. TaxID=1962857 RepID=UPI0025BB57BA|nr:transposase [Desulfurella sp.]